MKDVEKFIENEISVEDLIAFLVEEVYPNYPNFMELFESTDEIKNILRNNIKAIKRIPRDVQEGEAARYDVLKKEIQFYSKDKIDIDTLRTDNDMKHIIVHETIHAVFNKTKSRKETTTGCSSDSKKNKKIIRGAFEGYCNFKRRKKLTKKVLEKRKIFHAN